MLNFHHVAAMVGFSQMTSQMWPLLCTGMQEFLLLQELLLELLGIDFSKVDMLEGSHLICQYNVDSKLSLTSGL